MIEKEYGKVLQFINEGVQRLVVAFFYYEGDRLVIVTPGYIDPWESMPSFRIFDGVTVKQNGDFYLLDTAKGLDGTLEAPTEREKKVLKEWRQYMKKHGNTEEQEWARIREEIKMYLKSE